MEPSRDNGIFFFYPHPNGAWREAGKQASKQAGRQASKQATKAPGEDSKKKNLLSHKGFFFSLLSSPGGTQLGDTPSGKPSSEPAGWPASKQAQAAGPATGEDSKNKKTFAASKVFFCLLSSPAAAWKAAG